MRKTALFTLMALAAACTGNISENKLSAKPLSLTARASGVVLGNLGGFADERGGGVFADADGKAVRLRLDGSEAALESHPGNSVPPGETLRVFPAGPFSALVATTSGLYVAESGWLIEPPWRDQLAAEGVVGAALGADGVAWIAHRDGLFHIDRGALSELLLDGKPIRDITALAAAPAPNGASAVWFAQGNKLSFASQTARLRYEVSSAGPDAEQLEDGILGLAGLSASPGSPGELWLITAHNVLKLADHGWVSFKPSGKPEALISAGRFLWLRAGPYLYRYDADQASWGEVDALEEPATLLAADPSGSVWVRAGDDAYELSEGSLPRLYGVFEAARVYQTDVRVRARVALADQPEAVSFVLDEGEPVERLLEAALPGEGGVETLDFALGGFDAAGREKSFSLAGLADGMHTLTVTARLPNGERRRTLHFEYRAAGSALLSFAKDIVPIIEARCAKCHASGSARELETYEQWVAEKDSIVNAVVELRMPADGPLDPGQIELLGRWAAGEAAP